MEYETHQVLLQRISQRVESIRRQEASAWEFPRQLGAKVAELFQMASELSTVGSLNEAGDFAPNSFDGGGGTVNFLVRVDFPVRGGDCVHFDIPVPDYVRSSELCRSF
jgi:hypothetical protein